MMIAMGSSGSSSSSVRLFGFDIAYKPSVKLFGVELLTPNSHFGKRSNYQPLVEFSSSTKKQRKSKKERRKRPSKEEISKAKIDPPPLPQELVQKIRSLGCPSEEPTLVMQKYMYYCDVDNHHCRLLIPKGEIREPWFLTKQETMEVNELGREMKVKVVQLGSSRKERKLVLSRWPKPKTGDNGEETKKVNSLRYALQSGWREVVGESEIKEGDVIQVWAFRYGQDRNLGFIVLKIDVNGNHKKDGKGEQVENGNGIGFCRVKFVNRTFQVGESSGTKNHGDIEDTESN